MTNARILLSSLLLWVGACSRVESAEEALPHWRVSTAPDLELVDPPGADPFHRITGAARLSNGDLVVANAGAQQLVQFDSSGRFLRTLGRRGDGPGEFAQNIHWIGRRGDTLLLYDHSQRRMTSLTFPKGEFSMIEFTPRGIDRPLNAVAPLSGGRWLVEALGSNIVDGVDELYRDTSRIGVLEADGAVRWLVNAPKGSWMRGERASGTPTLPDPFEPGPWTRTLLRDERVYIADPDAAELRVFTLQGTQQSTIALPLPRGAVHAQLIDNVAAREKSENSSPARLSFIERKRRVAHRVGRWSFYRHAFFDELGLLWIEKYRYDHERPAEYLVVDATGRAMADVRLPRVGIIREVGAEYLLLSYTDEVGAERVGVFPLNRKPR